MNDEEYQDAFLKGYSQGRLDAADAVRNACSVLGGEAALNIHFITSAAEG